MSEEIAFENSRISNFDGLVTLTLNQIILHTVVHHSSTSTYRPNFIEIEETFLWTDGRTYVRTFENGRRGSLEPASVDIIDLTRLIIANKLYLLNNLALAVEALWRPLVYCVNIIVTWKTQREISRLCYLLTAITDKQGCHVVTVILGRKLLFISANKLYILNYLALAVDDVHLNIIVTWKTVTGCEWNIYVAYVQWFHLAHEQN